MTREYNIHDAERYCYYCNHAAEARTGLNALVARNMLPYVLVDADSSQCTSLPMRVAYLYVVDDASPSTPCCIRNTVQKMDCLEGCIHTVMQIYE